jgi:hypothetical protein
MSKGDYSKVHRSQLPGKKSTPPLKPSPPPRHSSELKTHSIFKAPNTENSSTTALDAALFTLMLAAANKA